MNSSNARKTVTYRSGGMPLEYVDCTGRAKGNYQHLIHIWNYSKRAIGRAANASVVKQVVALTGRNTVVCVLLGVMSNKTTGSVY